MCVISWPPFAPINAGIRHRCPRAMQLVEVRADPEAKKRVWSDERPIFGRFKDALKEVTGLVQSNSAVKMRLDRVFYSRMRRPVSDTTTLALAYTLGWTMLEFEDAIAQFAEIANDLKR
jgi:hypothetical protein